MVITKKHVSRRTILRGVGAAIALPWLESMVPALTALEKSGAAPVRRLGVFYLPNGMALPYWQVETEGPLQELPPILASLQPFKDDVLLIGGLSNDEVAQAAHKNKGGGHSSAAGTFLSSVPFDAISESSVTAGITMDQIAGREFAKLTQLGSLELGMEAAFVAGGCETSCSLTNSISWSSPTTPLAVDTDPRSVFERLFGGSGSTDAAARRAYNRRSQSILDVISEQIRRLDRQLGPADRHKFHEYVDSIRDVERRIQVAEAQNARELPVMEQPLGAPADFGEHAALMMDLLALAYQVDLTRVCTFMMGRELSGRAYPQIGVPESHHPVSHHQGDPSAIERLSKINAYHAQQFAHLVQKLSTIQEGDATVLDHSLLLYGAGISEKQLAQLGRPAYCCRRREKLRSRRWSPCPISGCTPGQPAFHPPEQAGVGRRGIRE